MKALRPIALASLTGISSAINLASSIYFGTTYGSDAFGILATQFSVATILSILTSWRADYYSIQDKSFADIVSFIVISSAPIFAASFYWNNGPHTALWIFGIALFSACTYKSISDDSQITIGYFRLLNVALMVAIQLLLTVTNSASTALFHGAAIGSFLTAIIYCSHTYRGLNFNIHAHQYFTKNFKKLTITSASWLLENSIFMLIPILGYYLATSTELGYYSFIDRFFKVPVGILASSVAPFLIAKIIKSEKLSVQKVAQYWLVIGSASAAALLIIYFGVEHAMILLWGEKWRPSLNYSIPLFLFYLAHITFTATNSIYTKFHKFSLLTTLQGSLLILIATGTYLFRSNFEFIVWIYCLLYTTYQFSNALCQLYVLRQFNSQTI